METLALGNERLPPLGAVTDLPQRKEYFLLMLFAFTGVVFKFVSHLGGRVTQVKCQHIFYCFFLYVFFNLRNFFVFLLSRFRGSMLTLP